MNTWDLNQVSALAKSLLVSIITDSGLIICKKENLLDLI